MGKHLKEFQTFEEYDNFMKSEKYLYPNVSYIINDDILMYDDYQNRGDIIKNYLRFTSLKDSTISLTNNGYNTPNVEYSFDGINNWTTWDYSEINLPSGTTVYMRGNNPNGFSSSSSKYSTFNMTGKIESHGNIMSLLYDDDFEDKLSIPSSNCYYRMFYACTSLTTAPELPATTLTDYCYYGMFTNCISLTTASELPATTLANSCYSYMFYGCTSLTTAPSILPTIALSEYCYYYMFYGCSSLTTAPELPSTRLKKFCYYGMFIDCISLTTAPELPATTLDSYCYSCMFSGCTSLNNITMLATNVNVAGCLLDWVNGVATTGTFTKSSSMTSLLNGNSGIPEGWEIINYG